MAYKKASLMLGQDWGPFEGWLYQDDEDESIKVPLLPHAECERIAQLCRDEHDSTLAVWYDEGEGAWNVKDDASTFEGTYLPYTLPTGETVYPLGSYEWDWHLAEEFAPLTAEELAKDNEEEARWTWNSGYDPKGPKGPEDV